MALSIASTGLSLGGVILTPLSILMVDSLGFDIAAPLIGVIYLFGVVPVSWMFLRVSPESMGLLPDGQKSESKQAYGRSGGTESEDDGISFEGTVLLGPQSCLHFFDGCSSWRYCSPIWPCEGTTFRSRNSNCGRDLTCI